MDFESETFVATVAGAITGAMGRRCGAPDGGDTDGHLIPEIAQTLRARDGAKGVDSDCTDTLVPLFVTAIPIHADATRGDSRAATMSKDAAGAMRLRDPGLGVGRDGDPGFTVMAGPAHAVAVTGDITHALNTANNGKGSSEDGTGRGVPTIAYPLLEVGKRTGASTTDARAGIGIGGDADPMFTLQAGAQHGVAYRTSGNCGAWETGDRVDALTTGTDQSSHLLAFSAKDHGADAGAISPTLRAMNSVDGNQNAGGQVAVAFAENQRNELRLMDIAGSQSAIRRGDAKNETLLAGTMSVRRLTPLECLRLQGFPDGYDLIAATTRRGNAKWRRVDADEAAYLAAQGAEVTQDDDGRWQTNAVADGPRYKGLGNSWNVDAVRWVFRRLDAEWRRSMSQNGGLSNV